MATVTPTVANSGLAPGVGSDDGSIVLYTWNLTTANVDGVPVAVPEWADCTVQAVASNWGGATLTWQGANVNADANFDSLSNAADGAAAQWTADGVKTIIENPLFMRPKLTTAGTGAIVSVTLLKRRTNPMRQ
jgi:hypothetical protein